MANIKIDYREIIDSTFQEIKNAPNKGEIATYIPALGEVDIDKFGISLLTTDGKSYNAGDYNELFSIQSVAKVLALSLAYEYIGEKIWDRVGVEPSGMAFNSIIQLELENGIPRNPLINAGAIVICDIIMSNCSNPSKRIIDFIQILSPESIIHYDERIAQSEKETGFRNFAIINLMKSFGNIENDVNDVLDLYFHLSSIKMSCETLAKVFVFLANCGKSIHSDNQIMSAQKSKRISAIMETCGFYDEAGEFAFSVGLPGKSGVGGGIVAILPHQYAISTWSPRLNAKGNSYRGLEFLKKFTSQTNKTIF